MNLFIIGLVTYAAFFDLMYCKIPNKSIIAILILGLTQATLNITETHNLIPVPLFQTLLGFAVGLFICIPFYALGMFGAGDAKLLASLGIIIGYPNIIHLIAITLVFSGLICLLRLACSGELLPFIKRWIQSFQYGVYIRPSQLSVAASGMPMGGAILLATTYYYLYI
ncbi:A24 family peptidase [Photobacterium ganghwense]|uniref:A24 family peptidase n=1 Tax=Photobacterium ganghwense TaxID=320778 RepID=UPI004056BC1A